ncbi:ATP-binding cassette domain-containing protein [Nodosilinea sp. PGN35]|uniref:ABC transporter ATP-binding protein n=1 Tax=Nodosilinea sp. PGN35 TaxID=3020489 RepID=UPI0023B2BEE8|nr:ATP-binding cassette domain-containing protein [Nodosilinea sp. TSF1-S3]MDF0365269.1 ATP-binding cassette domain-containing protein [Nodosilinea sp. TSF1-S3]
MELNQPLLSVENLGRQLSHRWLWRGVSFELRSGDWMGLVAPSGAGKTLLLRNLVLLDPIQQGAVSFEGKTPIEWGLPAYRSRVMVVPQRAIAFEGTVQANLQQVFDLGVYSQRRFDSIRIQAWLDKLGRSASFLQLQGSRLSGGEAQILALLRALQLDPQVLLLDEPTASLDAATTAQVEALLRDWLQEPGRACILTSHDTEQIHRVTNRQLNLGEFA